MIPAPLARTAQGRGGIVRGSTGRDAVADCREREQIEVERMF